MNRSEVILLIGLSNRRKARVCLFLQTVQYIMDQWDVVLVHQFRFLYWNLNKLLLTQMLLERKSAVTTVKLQIAGIVLGIKMIIGPTLQ